MKLRGKTVDTRNFNFENGILAAIREMYGVAADADSYKLSHYCQYLPGATRMMSYIESRGGKFDVVVNFGAQLIIKEYLMGVMTHERVDNMKEFAEAHVGFFDEKAWRKIVDVYGGKLPIRIRNAQEGLAIPVKNVLLTIETTVDDTDVFSLVSYLETMLLRLWHSMTVATLSWHIWEVIMENLSETSDFAEDEIPHKMIDFGSRGGAGFQGGAAFGGSGHLVNFQGSDTMIAIITMNLAYHSDMSAFSIPASEHSTTTVWGKDGETRFLGNMFECYAKKQNAILASVADSYNVEHFIKQIIGVDHKQHIIDTFNEYGTTYVVRPDSNDAVRMPIQCIKWLDEIFGHTVNGKGYKVLNYNVRVIQGDGIDIDDLREILAELKRLGYSGTNIAFGMGGGLLQKMDRDTCKFAMKCCAVKVDGVWHDVYKNPAKLEWLDGPDAEPTHITGETFKMSKRGRLTLITDGTYYKTIRLNDDDTFEVPDESWYEALEDIYVDGDLVRDMDLDTVRLNARKSHTRFPMPPVAMAA